MRYSRQREALVDLLNSTKSHPNAEWLYMRLRKDYPNISLGTVYRNLRQLLESGQITELVFGNTSHFDGDVSEHYHFHCTGCGAICDFPVSVVIPPAVSDCGFEVTGYNLMFHGLCPDCKNQQKNLN